MEGKDPLLGAFPKLRKATISLVMSACVCVSDCVEQRGFQWNYSYKNLYLCIFRISVRKFKFYYILTRVTGTVQAFVHLW
jgi:hypothetical protein